jgi:hypothetical protein
MGRQPAKFAFLGAIAGFILTSVAASAAEPWVEAARKREEAFRSVEIEFRLVEFVAKGSLPIPPFPGVKTEGPIPPVDRTVESTSRIVMDGAKVRYEDSRPHWDFGAKDYLAKITVGVGNGELSKAYCPGGIGQDSRRTGVIMRTTEAKGINSSILLGLTYNLRGLQPTICPYLVSELKPSGLTQLIGGHLCNEYTIAVSPTNVLSVWMDPKCEYVIRRIRWLLAGRVFYQIDVTFMSDPAAGWRPASWTWSLYNTNGQVDSSCNGIVTSFKMNPSISPDTFELTFPEGTLIHDNRDGKRYIVQPNGDWQQVNGLGEPTDSTISPIGSSWIRRNRWLLAGSMVSVVLLIGAWVVVRRRSSQSIIPGAN